MGDLRVGNPIYHLLDVEKQLKSLSTQIMGRPMAALERENQQLAAAQTEEVDRTQEKIAADQAAGLWGYINSLIDVVNLVFGGVLITSGADPITGYTLASASLLSLTNTALVAAGKWNEFAAMAAQGDEETQRRIADLMPLLVRLISISLGTYGLVKAGYAGRDVDQIIDRLRILSEWLSVGSNAGGAYFGLQAAKAEGHFLVVNKDVYLHEQAVKRLGGEVSNLMHLFQEASSSAKKPAKAYFQEMMELTKKA